MKVASPRRVSCSVLLWATLASGCGDAPSSGPIQLARLPLGSVSYARATELSHLVLDEEGAPWLRLELERGDWRRAPLDGRWVTDVGLMGLAPPDVEEPNRLLSLSDDRTFVAGGILNQSNPYGFYVAGARLFLDLPESELPPESAVLDQRFQVRSIGEAGTFRAHSRRASGDGFGLMTGESLSLRLGRSDATRLRGVLCVEPLEADALLGLPTESGTRAREPVEVTWTDGELLLERLVLEAPAAGAVHAVSIELPASRDRDLRLSVSGLPAIVTLLDPVLTAEADGARSERPDILLFQADTLRADTVPLLGDDGTPLAPHVRAFADGGVEFERVWSTGTHTLPAHGSLLASLLPPQAQLWAHGDVLPDSADTLAERLSEEGYRTIAVTDSVVVSSLFGFSQGFDVFSESNSGVESTLDRIRTLVAGDDPRPLFLFVQTYCMHTPYEPTDAARRRLGQGRPGLDADRFEDLDRLLRAAQATRDAAALSEWTPRLRALYDAQLHDLDRLFGSTLAHLDERRGPGGIRVFTSDHGEAFGEHGEYWHGGVPYEEQARVPLVVQAPGLQPARSQRQTSLLDVAGSILDLAGVRRPPSWTTGSVFDDGDPGAALTFRAYRSVQGAGTVAVTAWPHKLYLREESVPRSAEDVLGAAHLAEDPREERPYRSDRPEAQRPDWALPLLERLAPTLEAAYEVRARGTSVVVDAAKREELDALGY